MVTLSAPDFDPVIRTGRYIENRRTISDMLRKQMNPQIIAISGAVQGTIFPLTEDEIFIGRDLSNNVYVNDPSVSRHHCKIRRTNESDSNEPQFSLLDLESHNGTFVNGVPVSDQHLVDGDHFSIGDVGFIFLTHDPDPIKARVRLSDDNLVTRSIIKLSRENALYLHTDQVSKELPGNARVAIDLNTLLKIATTINSVRDLDQLQHRLLALMLDAFPAEREAILILTDKESFGKTYGWNRLTGLDNTVVVSRTIATEVLRDNVAVLSNDVFENENTSGIPSLVASRVCSLLCVPLIVFDQAIGVIYLDTTNRAERFDEEHLQLLTAIAEISAVALDNALHVSSLQDENKRLQGEIQLQHRMVGDSQPMRDVYAFLAKVAPTESTVLIRGESGTGKELAAHAIHLNSPRAKKPFVGINCATLSETLLESELFGHEKGAFTGAVTQKRGKLEIAEGGTIFLDEVAELTPVIQAKLLRVLQERAFERVGGTHTIKVRVRIVAATNKDLAEAIKLGTFRQDLYYRLNVVSLVMPSLRQRREDISLLANYFLSKFSQRCKRKLNGISVEARQILRSYDWPGNVRELENALERAVVLGSTNIIQPEDLPEDILESSDNPLPTKFHEGVKEAKRRLVVNALEQTEGNYTAAADFLGIHPNNLHRLIRTLNLKRDLQK
jgi:transcriptional regulator with GAF, ATPase, and Fis domain